MVLRKLSCLALLFLLPAAGLAQNGDQTPPTVIIRVKSLQAVIDNAKLLASLAGKEGMAQQIEGLVRAKIGDKGLKGVDPNRAFGFYGRVGKDIDDISGVIMIPVADEQEFLTLLANMGYPAKKGREGVYSIATEAPVEAYLRFANKYAYVTAINADALQPERMFSPAQVFSDKQAAAIWAGVRIDQIPQPIKFLVLAQIEQQLAEAEEKREPGETAAQHKFRVQALRHLAKQLAQVLNEGAALSAGLDIDREKEQFVLQLALTGKPNTELATRIRDAGQRTSAIAAIAGYEAAASGQIHLVLPEAVAAAFEKLITQNMEKGVNKIQDEQRRRQAEEVVQAVQPTLRAGEVDSAFVLRGPGPQQHYGFVAAFKVKEGEKLAKTIRELVEQTLPDLPPAERAKIKLDVDSAGGVKIHRVDAQAGYDEKTRKVFGDNPFYLAFRSDAVFVAIGEDALPALKKAVASKTTAKSPALSFEVALARLAPLYAKTEKQKAAVEKLFTEQDEGRIRFTVTGGAALEAQFLTRLSVLRFMGAVAGPGGRLRFKDVQPELDRE